MKRMMLVLVSTAALSACATAPREAPTQTCPDGSIRGLTEPCPPPPPPPLVTCPDGSVVAANAVCPLPPPPPPPPPVRRSGERG